jgi:hypothetical protein
MTAETGWADVCLAERIPVRPVGRVGTVTQRHSSVKSPSRDRHATVTGASRSPAIAGNEARVGALGAAGNRATCQETLPQERGISPAISMSTICSARSRALLRPLGLYHL